jgi:hypothetical protein
MTITTGRPTNSYALAQSKWDEASRITQARKIVLQKRQHNAWALTGKPGELEAWASVAEAERELLKAEQDEVLASSDVAWEEKVRNARRMHGRR